MRNVFKSDLPTEHMRSSREPTTTVRGTQHIKSQTKRPSFSVPAPQTGQMYNFIVGDNAELSRVLGANPNRRNLFVQNLGANNVYLTVGTQAGESGTGFTGGIVIPPNGAYEFPAFCAPINDIYLVSDITGNPVTVFEGILTKG